MPFTISAGAITGGISALTGLTNLYFSRIRKVNDYKQLIKGLQSVKAAHPAKRLPNDDELLAQWLVHSDLIVEGIKQRTRSHIAIAIPILISCSGVISVDTSGKQILGIRGLESFDLVIFAVQLIVALVSTSSIFLGEMEKDFLSYMPLLHHRFYELYVRGAILEFNAQMRQINYWDYTRNRVEKERQEIQKLIRGIFNKNLIGTSGTNLNDEQTNPSNHQPD